MVIAVLFSNREYCIAFNDNKGSLICILHLASKIQIIGDEKLCSALVLLLDVNTAHGSCAWNNRVLKALHIQTNSRALNGASFHLMENVKMSHHLYI